MIKGLFLCLLATSLWASADLSQTEEWLKLVHYKKNFFGGHTSEADSPSFFLAKDGRSNPESELKADIEHIFENKKYKDPNQHPACRFPARRIFLEKKLGKKITVTCPKWEAFNKRVSAKSVSLVFSSYYLDAPASAFGHTLIKFGKQKHQDDSERYELLDYAINYAADVTTSNALLYAVMGLTGGFVGRFSSMPYFYKIREYNDYESRDLWSYHLNLTQDEIDHLVAHVWEVGQTFFYYYYLTENCSYHMLSILDAVNPTWKLTDHIPYFVVPVDTIKAVYNVPGLVNKVGYRPSHRKVFLKRVNALNQNEEEAFKQASNNLEQPQLSQLNNQSQAKVLDALIDYIDYKFAKDVIKEKPEIMELKRKFLVARSKTKVKFEKLELAIPEREAPHKGHGSRRLSIRHGRGSIKKNYQTLALRQALHDFLDPSIGQNPEATMEMGGFRLRYYNDTNQLKVEDLTLARIISLNPLRRFTKSLSWGAKFGGWTVKDKGCDHCFAPGAKIYGGISQSFAHLLYWVFIGNDAEVSKQLSRRGYRYGIGPEAAILWRLSSRLNWIFSGEYKYRYFDNERTTYEFGSKIRWSFIKNWAIDANYTRYQSEWDIGSGLQFYF